MISGLEAVAERGEKIYRERYKAEYEHSYPDKYVVIDLDGEQAFVADTPEGALRLAVSSLPDGQFHLIKIGASAVFKVGYSRCGASSGHRTFGRS